MTEIRSEKEYDDWIRNLRPQKNPVDPWRPYACFVEKERSKQGAVEDVVTLFLTNKECLFNCLMCDLWKYTTDERVPVRAIPAQIQWGLEQLPAAGHIKLYNSGNFFDAQAVPPAEHDVIAGLLDSFRTVIVECHPLLVGKICLDFNRLLIPELQIAMGLETVNADILKKLNKRMTCADFEKAVNFLHKHNISTRAFILLALPYLGETASVFWAKRSVDFAFDSGVECCVIIPTRAGNGSLDRLRKEGLFSPPRVESLEEVQSYGIEKKAGRVFADLWDIEKFTGCKKCLKQRVERMHRMNLSQTILERVDCVCSKDTQAKPG